MENMSVTTINANLFVLRDDSLVVKTKEEKFLTSLLLTGKTDEDQEALQKNKFSSIILFPFVLLIGRNQKDKLILHFKEKNIRLIVECQTFCEDGFKMTLVKVTMKSVLNGARIKNNCIDQKEDQIFLSTMKKYGFSEVEPKEVLSTICQAQNYLEMDAKLLSNKSSLMDQIEYLNPRENSNQTKEEKDFLKKIQILFSGALDNCKH